MRCCRTTSNSVLLSSSFNISMSAIFFRHYVFCPSSSSRKTSNWCFILARATYSRLLIYNLSVKLIGGFPPFFDSPLIPFWISIRISRLRVGIVQTGLTFYLTRKKPSVIFAHAIFGREHFEVECRANEL